MFEFIKVLVSNKYLQQELKVAELVLVKPVISSGCKSEAFARIKFKIGRNCGRSAVSVDSEKLSTTKSITEET